VANLRHYTDICLEVEENHENVRITKYFSKRNKTNYLLHLLQGMNV
jgi:hypothetical protein